MDLEKILGSSDEKPLDHLVDDGGFCRVFRTIGCIGDSLSSGEHESRDKDGKPGWHDFYEYSWGQYIARNAGIKVFNFSRGGMTAKWYYESFADEKGAWAQDRLCQAYILALGINDINNKEIELGSVDDIDLENYNNNKPTFAGFYAKIIQRLKSLQPDAKFFLVTLTKGERIDPEYRHAKLLRDMVRLFDKTYVIDLAEYGPEYNGDFKKKFYVGGHMNAAGYLLTSKMIASYIDYIVRHHFEDFAQVGFIGTPYQYIDDLSDKKE